MDETQLAKEIKNGNVQIIPPPQQQTPVPQTPDSSLSQFIGLLTALRAPKQYVKTAPSLIPKTFLDQIQFYDDGVNRRLYLYINNTWRYVTLT